ncbi:MAG: hypothetical protein QM662_19365, partial [Gordonia sp. (in: high G+C Gram-positive bacteria)]
MGGPGGAQRPPSAGRRATSPTAHRAGPGSRPGAGAGAAATHGEHTDCEPAHRKPTHGEPTHGKPTATRAAAGRPRSGGG